jgi:deazaflavin-dependent oxidoreductase (nitroreductase family)
MPPRLPSRAYLVIGDIVTNHRFSRFHRRLFRRTGGRGIGGFLGLEVILVTATGRRTGEPRTVPLGAVRDGDRWLVVGSNAGHHRMPAWAFNLRAHPDVTVETRAGSALYHAHEADGDEADRLWPVAISVYPGYADYRTRTDRAIPLFVLEPAGVG